jgi:hypothetical protein
MGLVRQDKSNVACRPVAGRKKCLKGDYTGSIARRATNDSRALLLFILLHSRYDLSVAHDLLRNIREFIRLRLGRTRSDYKRRDGFRNDRLLAVGNRRKVAEEVIVVIKRRLMLRLRALRVT